MFFTITLICVFSRSVQDLRNRNSVFEQSEKWKDYNENMMLKVFYLCGFDRRTKCIWAIENNYLLVCKLFEFASEWVSTITNKAEIISVKKITCNTAISDKKIVIVFCVSEALCSSTPQVE